MKGGEERNAGCIPEHAEPHPLVLRFLRFHIIKTVLNEPSKLCTTSRHFQRSGPVVRM